MLRFLTQIQFHSNQNQISRKIIVRNRDWLLLGKPSLFPVKPARIRPIFQGLLSGLEVNRLGDTVVARIINKDSTYIIHKGAS